MPNTPRLSTLMKYEPAEMLRTASRSPNAFIKFERTRRSEMPPTRLVRFINRHGELHEKTLRAWNIWRDIWVVENYTYAKLADPSLQSAHGLPVLEYIAFTEDDIEMLPRLVHAINRHIKRG